MKKTSTKLLAVLLTFVMLLSAWVPARTPVYAAEEVPVVTEEALAVAEEAEEIAAETDGDQVAPPAEEAVAEEPVIETEEAALALEGMGPVPVWDGRSVSWPEVDEADGYEIAYFKQGLAHEEDTVYDTTYDLTDYIEENGAGTYIVQVWAFIGEDKNTMPGQATREFFEVTVAAQTLSADGTQFLAEGNTGGYLEGEAASGDAFTEDIDTGAITGVFGAGDEISITAVPEDGYEFVSFEQYIEHPNYIDGITDNPFVFTVAHDQTALCAQFAPEKTFAEITLDLGEAHAALAAGEDLAGILQEQGFTDIAVSGSAVTMKLDTTTEVSVGTVQRKLGTAVDETLSGMRKDAGEYFLSVGQYTIDNYETATEVAAELAEATEALGSEATFYVLWAVPLEALSLTIVAPECGTEVSAQLNNEADPNGGYDVFSQDVRPDITVVSDGATLAQTMGGDYAFWMAGEMEPFVGVMKGENTYEARALLLFDFGKLITEETAITVNDGAYTASIADVNAERAIVKIPIPVEHVWESEGEITKEPTTAEEGVKTYHCEHFDVCGGEKTEVIPKLPEMVKLTLHASSREGDFADPIVLDVVKGTKFNDANIPSDPFHTDKYVRTQTVAGYLAVSFEEIHNNSEFIENRIGNIVLDKDMDVYIPYDINLDEFTISIEAPVCGTNADENPPIVSLPAFLQHRGGYPVWTRSASDPQTWHGTFVGGQEASTYVIVDTFGYLFHKDPGPTIHVEGGAFARHWMRGNKEWGFMVKVPAKHVPGGWEVDEEDPGIQVRRCISCGEILEERETATDILTEDENYILARVGEVPDGVWAVLWNEDETSIVGDGYMTYVYDALAKKPHVHVYNHRQRLVEKKDYSLSYKNNTKAYNERNNAGELIVDAGKTPTVILSTKGNFVGKESLYFSIEPASFADYNDRIRSAGEVSYKQDSGKKVKVTIPVSFENGSGKTVKLTAGSDYTLEVESIVDAFGVEVPEEKWGEYFTADKKKAYFTVNADKAGDYAVRLVGAGNFTEHRNVNVVVDANRSPMDKAAVKVEAKASDLVYTGEEVLPDITVTASYKDASGKTQKVTETLHGEVEGEPPYSDGVLFIASIEDNIEVGTARIVVFPFAEGGQFFSGEKEATFKILPAGNLKNAEILYPAKVGFIGEEIILETVADGDAFDPAKQLRVQAKNGKVLGDVLKEGEDYIVAYKNNIKAGKVTMTFTGTATSGYAGTTATKTFTIDPIDLTKANVAIIVNEGEDVPFVKAGAKPKVRVAVAAEDFRGQLHEFELVEGTDFTVAYKNNTKVSKDQDGTQAVDEAKLPTVTVTGKGNFKGKATQSFQIIRQDNKEYEKDGRIVTPLRIVCPDVLFKNKADNWVGKPKVVDENGKALSKNDYTAIEFSLDEDFSELLEKNAPALPAGTTIYMRAEGLGNYAGNDAGTPVEITGAYRIMKADIAKAKVQLLDFDSIYEYQKGYEYTGAAIEPTKDQMLVTLKIDGTEYMLDTDGKPEYDYEIVEGSYEKNVAKGTASFVIRGTGEIGGTKKVTFKITQRKIENWWERFTGFFSGMF